MSIVTVVALVVLHVSVTGCPGLTLAGAAVICAVGAGFEGVGARVEPFKEPPPHPIWNDAMKATAKNKRIA